MFSSQPLVHVFIVDSEIPSLGAKWVTGHLEGLGMTDVFGSIDLPNVASHGKNPHVSDDPRCG